MQETRRNNIPSDAYSANADERTLFELYYHPIAVMAEAGVSAVMGAYNRVNGTGACENHDLLVRDLRQRIGFRGWVMSDWWAVGRTGAQPAGNGMDQNMAGNDYIFDEPFLTAGGYDVEAMARRVLTGMLTAGGRPLGALDSPACTAGCDCYDEPYYSDVRQQEDAPLARELGAAGAVLLKNEGSLLPLPATTTVALLGAACDASHDLEHLFDSYAVGDYYVVGGSGRVIGGEPVSLRAALESRSPTSDYLRVSTVDDVPAALSAMQGADVAIACGGAVSTEGSDRPSLLLDQHAFLSALASATTIPLVVLTYSPGPLITSPWATGATAILNMFFSGEQAGHAAADILFGEVNPSGRLPLTYPLSESQMTGICQTLTCPISEGLSIGWRRLHNQPVAFPFGHGLSYTNFSYAWAALPTSIDGTLSDPRSNAVSLEVAITNTGNRSGREVVQVYLSYPDSAGEPPLVLRGFSRTQLLLPGAMEVLRFDLSKRDVSTWQPEHGWVRASGIFKVVVGASSRDERLTHDLAL